MTPPDEAVETPGSGAAPAPPGPGEWWVVGLAGVLVLSLVLGSLTVIFLLGHGRSTATADRVAPEPTILLPQGNGPSASAGTRPGASLSGAAPTGAAARTAATPPGQPATPGGTAAAGGYHGVSDLCAYVDPAPAQSLAKKPTGTTTSGARTCAREYMQAALKLTDETAATVYADATGATGRFSADRPAGAGDVSGLGQAAYDSSTTSGKTVTYRLEVRDQNLVLVVTLTLVGTKQPTLDQVRSAATDQAAGTLSALRDA